MAEEKTIAVVGATGFQGGSLVRAILGNGEGPYRVRALTRKPDSDRARELASRGVEVIQADLDDRMSLEKAFRGAEGAFCVTNFWEHFDPEKEGAQTRNMAEAAKAAGVKHVVWSTLEDVREWVPLSDDRMPTLMERYKVPHFDGKGAADRYFQDSGVPTTYFRVAFYWENLIHFGMNPKRGPDGVPTITMPLGDKKLPGIAVEDIGRCALGVFKKGTELAGEAVGVAGEHLTGDEMAAALTEALGLQVRYHAPSPDEFRGYGFPGAEDLGNMFQFIRDFNDEHRAARAVETARELNPELLSFREWLAEHKDRIRVE